MEVLALRGVFRIPVPRMPTLDVWADLKDRRRRCMGEDVFFDCHVDVAM